MRETAGISRFRYRKEESERRLSQAERICCACGTSFPNWKTASAP
ncbi:MAG: hypothetical protein ACLS8R_06875 [Anaeromassilibacillus sp.]